jgi:LacI family transcriptional regulator
MPRSQMLPPPDLLAALPTPATGAGVTLQQIADHCGVSKCTVSLALNGSPRISAATATRVRVTAATLGYNPDLHAGARRLAMRKQGKAPINRIVALFFPTPPTIGDSYFSQEFNGVMAGLLEEKFGLLALDSPSFAVAPAGDALWSAFTRGDVDGVIISHGTDKDTLCERVRANPGFSDRPIVHLISPTTKAQDLSVHADDTAGGYLATQHLLALGHRHVLQFVFPIHSGLEQPEHILRRQAGASRALADAGLAPDTHLYLYPLPVPQKWHDPALAPRYLASLTANTTPADPASHAFLAYLAAHPHITAIQGLNDATALRVWQILVQAGYRVPEDYSLIGYDDTDPMLDATGQNCLTSIRIPLQAIGREAARIIVRAISDSSSTPPAVTLPVDLMDRASTGQAPSR